MRSCSRRSAGSLATNPSNTSCSSSVKHSNDAARTGFGSGTHRSRCASKVRISIKNGFNVGKMAADAVQDGEPVEVEITPNKASAYRPAKLFAQSGNGVTALMDGDGLRHVGHSQHRDKVLAHDGEIGLAGKRRELRGEDRNARKPKGASPSSSMRTRICAGGFMNGSGQPAKTW